MSSKKDYIDYVRDVLGVKSLHGLTETATEAISIPLVIYVEEYLEYSADEKDLLQKMLGALKVPLLQMLTLDLKDQQAVDYKMRVFLTNEKPKNLIPSLDEIHTFSPRTLLQNPALKKVAWDDLQKVLLFFQTKN